MSNNKLKHPRALIPLTLCYALFMAAFGGILASLTLYQTNQLHMPAQTAYGVFAAAMALLWILPVAGGYISGKLGYVAAATIGILVCALGMASFCLNDTHALYLGLALFVVGNALATPAIWCMVDHCYSKDSPLRESGFTLFYLFFNLGVMFGIFLGGYLAQKWGFVIEFSFDTLCLLLAFFLLLFSSHRITPHKGRSIVAQVSCSKAKLYGALCLAVIIGTPISILLFDHFMFNNILTLVLLIVMVMFFLHKAFKMTDAHQRNCMIAFVCLSVAALAFWTLYSLEPSFLSVFVQNNVDTSFLGFKIPATSFFAFDAVFVILVGLILSRVWLYLSMKGKNPSLPFKFALSLLIIGLGFVYLASMIIFNKNAPIPAHDVVIAYAIFATGELLIGPLGISMVGRLAPEGEEGLMMGFWQLAIGVGGVVAGYIAIASHLPATALPLAQSNPIYFKVFLLVGLGAVVAGIIVLLFTRKLARLMIEKPYVKPQI